MTSITSINPPSMDVVPTYINHKDLLGVIQELDFEVQHPGGRGCACGGPSDVSSAGQAAPTPLAHRMSLTAAWGRHGCGAEAGARGLTASEQKP